MATTGLSYKLPLLQKRLRQRYFGADHGASCRFRFAEPHE
jgi:hypothetical protein